MATNEQMISGAYGSRPTATGAGTKIFTANAYGFKALEDTTISAFKNAAGEAIGIGWEGVEIKAGDTIWFGVSIKSITVTSGGRGQYYLAETDSPTIIVENYSGGIITEDGLSVLTTEDGLNYLQYE